MRARVADRGVAMMEAAIVIPLIILLFLGVLEAGFAFRDGNTLSRATQQAARTGARLANDPLTDYEVLRALNSGLAEVSASSIERVVVYRANGTGTTPPEACRTGSGIGGLCNVYTAAQVTSDSPGSFGCGGGAWDSNFCPTNALHRNRNGTNPTRIGVWVELSFDMVTDVLPTSMKLTRGAVYELEPCSVGVSTCGP